MANIKKTSAPLVETGLETSSPAVDTSNKQTPHTKATPTTKTVDTGLSNSAPKTENTIKPVTVEGHPSARSQQTGTGAGAHTFSPNVKALQETLLHYAQEMQQMLPHVFKTENSDSFSSTNAKKLGLDSGLIGKVRELARKTGNDNVGYADGLWGQKTQDALNGIFEFIKQAGKLSKQAPQDGGAVEQLAKYGAGLASFKDIPTNKVNQYAGYLNYILDKANPLTYIRAIDAASKEAEIPAVRDARLQDDTLPDKANRKNTGFNDLTKENDPASAETKKDDKTTLVSETTTEETEVEQIKNEYPYGFPVPFDLNTDQINIVNINHFIVAVSTTINKLQFAQSNNNLVNIGNALMQYTQEALAQAGALQQTLPSGKVSFSIDYNNPQRAENFLQNVPGESEFGMQKYKSENILTRTSTLCNTIVSLLQQLKSAPTFVALMNGANSIDAQINKGSNSRLVRKQSGQILNGYLRAFNKIILGKYKNRMKPYSKKLQYLSDLSVMHSLIDVVEMKKEAQDAGVMSGLASGIKEYVSSLYHPDDPVDSILAFLAPGILTASGFGWVAFIYEVAEVLGFDFIGFFNSIRQNITEFIKTLVSNKQPVSQEEIYSQINSAATKAADEHFNGAADTTKLTEIALKSPQMLSSLTDDIQNAQDIKQFALAKGSILKLIKTAGILGVFKHNLMKLFIKMVSWLMTSALVSLGFAAAGGAVSTVVGLNKDKSSGGGGVFSPTMPSPQSASYMKEQVSKNIPEDLLEVHTNNNQSAWVESLPLQEVPSEIAFWATEVYPKLKDYKSALMNSAAMSKIIKMFNARNSMSQGFDMVAIPQPFERKIDIANEVVADFLNANPNLDNA